MKEDGMKNGEKGGYKVEIGRENEYWRNLGVYGNGRERVRLKGFLDK